MRKSLSLRFCTSASFPSSYVLYRGRADKIPAVHRVGGSPEADSSFTFYDCPQTRDARTFCTFQIKSFSVADEETRSERACEKFAPWVIASLDSPIPIAAAVWSLALILNCVVKIKFIMAYLRVLKRVFIFRNEPVSVWRVHVHVWRNASQDTRRRVSACQPCAAEDMKDEICSPCVASRTLTS